MNNQGLFGALWQYWNIHPQPRLDRRNTYLEDHTISNYVALKLGIVASLIAMSVIVFWALLGVII